MTTALYDTYDDTETSALLMPAAQPLLIDLSPEPLLVDLSPEPLSLIHRHTALRDHLSETTMVLLMPVVQSLIDLNPAADAVHAVLRHHLSEIVAVEVSDRTVENLFDKMVSMGHLYQLKHRGKGYYTTNPNTTLQVVMRRGRRRSKRRYLCCW